MSKESKMTAVPKLRFPEFKNSEEWEIKSLGSCLSEKPSYGANASAIPFSPKLPRYIRITDIDDFSSLRNNDPMSIGEAEASEYLLEDGDFLIARSGNTVGKSLLYKSSMGKCAHAGYLLKFRFNKEITTSTYFQFIAQSDYYWDWIKKNLRAGGQPNVNAQEYSSLKFFLPPSISEQNKIISILSSLNELIATQNSKVDSLKNYKNGLLQQLFPQDGETIPRLRFSEFKKSAEWKVRTFGETSELTMGFAFKSSDFVESGAQLIRMGNLYQNELSLSRNPVYLPIEFLDEFKKFQIQPNDILISMTGTAGKQDYGYAIIVPPNSKNLLLNQRITRVRAKQETFQHFLLHAMKHPSFTSHIYSNPGGTKQANLSIGDLSEIKIALPSKNEQQKVADCLSSLDDLITAKIDKIAVLKVHKKILLQQLFPRVTEDSHV